MTTLRPSEKKKRRRSRKGSAKRSQKVQKRKIGYTVKKGRIVNVYKISGKPGRRYYNGNKLVKGKKIFTTKAKARAFLKKNISKRTRKRSRRKSSFGSWWDNTQLTYCRPGSECANASTLSGYPFYSDKSDWKPYYPIKGSAFGASASFASSKHKSIRKLPTYSDDYRTFLNEFKEKLSSEREMDGEENIGGCDMLSDFN